MRGIDDLAVRLAELAGWKWLVGTFVACVLPIIGIYGVVAKYHVTDPAPDRSYAYTGAQAYEMLVRLGPAGRHGLVFVHALDYAYIAAYVLFFGIAIAGLASSLRSSSVWLRRLAVLPVLAGLADVFENLCVDAAILGFPKRIDLLLTLAGGFTTFKATLFPAFQLLTVLGLVLLLARSLLRRVRRGEPASAALASD